ncbi:hypothetical protein; putative signal peptide [Frankia alni ACN14a]|uniref:Uncharacterized protein n=1 Tax=Frankia alni (strain DSM 45986 / CECT 9034 / ACN14a) TaxID=326424 RepID=Q0RAX1_FRAAA|nr:hypothetical protein; putative signal peptide [Frankia alni ACN14a]
MLPPPAPGPAGPAGRPTTTAGPLRPGVDDESILSATVGEQSATDAGQACDASPRRSDPRRLMVTRGGPRQLVVTRADPSRARSRPTPAARG